MPLLLATAAPLQAAVETEDFEVVPPLRGTTAKGLRLPALSWDSPRAADEACAGHVVAEVIGIAADA